MKISMILILSFVLAIFVFEYTAMAEVIPLAPGAWSVVGWTINCGDGKCVRIISVTFTYTALPTGDGTLNVTWGLVEPYPTTAGGFSKDDASTTVSAPPNSVLANGDTLAFGLRNATTSAGSFSFDNVTGVQVNTEPTPCPEPATVISFLFGALGFAVKRFVKR